MISNKYIYRVLIVEGEYHLYYATGSKNFIRSFKKDREKLLRLIKLYRIVLNVRTVELLFAEFEKENLVVNN